MRVISLGIWGIVKVNKDNYTVLVQGRPIMQGLKKKDLKDLETVCEKVLEEDKETTAG